MSEYIDREAFLEQKRKQYCKDCARRKGMRNGKYKTLYEIGEAPCSACGIDDLLNDVEDFPAADVRPVVRGKWQFHMFTARSWGYECRVCHTTWDTPTNYCPNCGAKMDGGQDDV